MKYRILNSEYINHLSNAYNIKLANNIIEGERGTDYIHTTINGKEFLLAFNEVEEIKEVKPKTNKTAIVNSIFIADKKDIDFKEIANIKRSLKQCTLANIESIKHYYERLIQLYYLNAKNNNYKVSYELKKAVKLIINSSVKVDCWELKEVKAWDVLGIL